VEKIGESFGKRIVKVESSFLDQVENGEIDKLVSLLQPEVVLFDDFDRIDLNSNEGKFLYITEDLKRKYPRVTFFATVNNPGELSPALLRPGRFDEKIKFLPPGPRESCKIIQMYAASMQIQVDANSLEAAVGNRKFTPAECREAISRKVLRPELDMRFIMDDIERYRNFEDQEEDGKSDFDEDEDDTQPELLHEDESVFTESEAAALRDSIREIKNPRERAEVEKVLGPSLSAAKRPRKPKKKK
jgi:SpoVK/Ycf46/Vps4 family AAA+-type ATPase